MKFKFLELAKELSFSSSHKQHHHGAVIAKKNRVLGKGFNQHKTHSLSNHPYYSVHAELAAILDSRGSNIEGATLYIYRQKRDGSSANSKPCPYCEQLLRQYGIKDCYYTSELGVEYLIL